MVATITINGKTLQVWDREAPGGLGRTEKAIFAEQALRHGKPEDLPRLWAELVLAYVGENEGVDVAWLKANLPTSPAAIVRDCARASGIPVDEGDQGKAESPSTK